MNIEDDLIKNELNSYLIMQLLIALNDMFLWCI